MPTDVHRALRVYCVQRGMTMAEVVVEAIARFLDEEQREPVKRTKPPV